MAWSLGGTLVLLFAVGAGSYAFAAPPPSECPAGTAAFKLEVDDDNLGDGTYTDGTLSVTIDFTLTDEGEQKRFDWSANMGVDRVAVKAQGIANYDYDPEAMGGTGLTAPATKGISHITFCYDEEVVTPPPPPPACDAETEDCCETIPSDCPVTPPPPPACDAETEDCCETIPSDCPVTPPTPPPTPTCDAQTEDCCETIPDDCPEAPPVPPQEPPTEVPFFTSPATLLLGALGMAGAGLMLVRRQA